MFIVDPTDLHVATFNDDIGYHVIHEYSPLGDHLKKLLSEIYGKTYHDFEIDRSRLGVDIHKVHELQCIITEFV